MVESWLDLVADPAKIAAIPAPAILAVLCQLAAVQSALAARLLHELTPPSGHDQEGDVLLDVGEAAERLGTSKDWLYRHAKNLPFTVSVGPRQLRFSARGLARYIRSRQGR